PRRLGNAAGHGEEQHVSDRDEDECVLIMAPLGKDVTALAAFLYADGFDLRICAGADECSRQIAAGTGAVLLTEEALESPLLSNLLEVLKAQPPGPNYHSLFSQAAANLAGRDYWIWRLRRPVLLLC